MSQHHVTVNCQGRAGVQGVSQDVPHRRGGGFYQEAPGGDQEEAGGDREEDGRGQGRTGDCGGAHDLDRLHPQGSHQA